MASVSPLRTSAEGDSNLALLPVMLQAFLKNIVLKPPLKDKFVAVQRERLEAEGGGEIIG